MKPEKKEATCIPAKSACPWDRRSSRSSVIARLAANIRGRRNNGEGNIKQPVKLPKGDKCDCGASIGSLHKPGCLAERCSECGCQLATCGCFKIFPFEHRRIKWTGLYPGEAACVEFDWFVRIIPGKGFEKCSRDDEGAMPDLNRLVLEAQWDKTQKKFVKTNG